MKPTILSPWAFIAVCLGLMQMAAGAAVAQPLDFKVIAGKWARVDGSYTLRVEDITSEGAVSVRCFNPGEIHVAQNQISTQAAVGQTYEVIFVRKP